MGKIIANKQVIILYTTTSPDFDLNTCNFTFLIILSTFPKGTGKKLRVINIQFKIRN